MLGELALSGIGSPIDRDCVPSVDALRSSCLHSNTRLLAELREDGHAHGLVKATYDDAKLGRMSAPVPLEKDSPLMQQVLMHPRFGVEQERVDGTTKLRAVDHFSWSPASGSGGAQGPASAKKARKAGSVNGHAAAAERMHHDTVDALVESLLHFKALMGTVPGLIKADVDSAFRRIPVASKHRWACGVVFKQSNQVLFSRHAACPFGALASVHAWERIGAAIAFIARRYLKIAVLRYVDDFFAAERLVISCPLGMCACMCVLALVSGRKRWSMRLTVWDASSESFWDALRWPAAS